MHVGVLSTCERYHHRRPTRGRSRTRCRCYDRFRRRRHHGHRRRSRRRRRAQIGDAYTFANLRRCAAAAAQYYRDTCDAGTRGLVVGHDRRFSAREFAVAAAEVIAAHGVPVWLTIDATPTPVISQSVLDRCAAGAVNLTASHNPPGDLGFKVRDDFGAALAPENLSALEARLPVPGSEVPRVDLQTALADGRVRLFDPAPAYRAFVAERFDLPKIAAAGLRVAYDPMWGAGIGWLPWLLGPGARTTFTAIHNMPNPNFPEMQRPEPIPPNTDGSGPSASNATSAGAASSPQCSRRCRPVITFSTATMSPWATMVLVSMCQSGYACHSSGTNLDISALERGSGK